MLFSEVKNNLVKDNCYKIGKIFKPHGIDGQLNVSVYVALDEIEKESIIVDINGSLIPFFVDFKVSRFNDNSGIIKLIDVDTKEQAKLLNDCNIYLPKSELKNIEEVLVDFENFIIGYILKDAENEIIGEILDFIDDNKNPVYIVEYKDDEIYLPIHSIEILEVDYSMQIVKADVPPTLLEL